MEWSRRSKIDISLDHKEIILKGVCTGFMCVSIGTIGRLYRWVNMVGNQRQQIAAPSEGLLAS
jgi:hypothetical protein